MSSVIEQILDLARWAPSGDNEQPWRFEIVDETHFIVHAHDTSDWCVYDLDGRASQIAVGALLETIGIAASGFGCSARWVVRPESAVNTPVIDVSLVKNEDREPSPLLPCIKTRVTQRRILKTTPLSAEHKQQLEAAVGDGYQVAWIEGRKGRWKMAKLLFRSAYIRLTIPETYEVHRQNIEWGAQFSEDKIPDQAVGVDSLTLKIMRWTLKSWRRVQFMNKYFAGTILPRIQMDLLPGYCCGAHFVITSDKPLVTIADYFRGGAAMQRFWLTATSLGLQFQPEMTPLIFARYMADVNRFTENAEATERAGEVYRSLSGALGKGGVENGVFAGRLGFGSTPRSRSIRRAVAWR